MHTFDEVLFESFREMLLDCLSTLDSDGWARFNEALRQGLNKIGSQICKLVLESANEEFVANPEARPGWVVERHGDKKTILTVFGPVHYERTYFRHKKTKKYAYLADLIAGYQPHQRLDVLLEAEKVAKAVDLSYRKAGCYCRTEARETEVSGETVKNLIRRLSPEKHKSLPAKKPLRRCSRLYIEADEDHVARQVRKGEGPNCFEQKLVYIHEGRKKDQANRYRLVGTHYFTFSSGTPSLEIWQSVWQYIQETYDVEAIEEIFISGDGASWIKAGVDYLPCSHFVLDRFHLQKALLRAAGADKEALMKLSRAVWQTNRSEVNRLLRQLRDDENTESRKRAIDRTRTYLNNNWEGIRAYRTWEGKLASCSAEGHVSHVLSARLSSRPMGWSELGANQMAHLRVHAANGIDLRRLHIEARKAKCKAEIHVPTETIKALKQVVGSSHERLGNIPILQQKKGAWRTLLRNIATSSISFV